MTFDRPAGFLRVFGGCLCPLRGPLGVLRALGSSSPSPLTCDASRSHSSGCLSHICQEKRSSEAESGDARGSLRVSAAVAGHRWRSVWMTPGPCRRERRGPQGACTAGGVLWPGSPGGQPSLVHVGRSAPSHGWEMPPLNIAHSAELTFIFSRGWEAARPSPGSQRSHRCLYPFLLLGTLIGPPACPTPAMSEETQEGRT